MINLLKKSLSMFLLLSICISLISCNKKEAETELWENAIYTEDTEIGDGVITIKVLVTAGDKTVTFKVNTYGGTLGTVLSHYKLIDGEQGAYGLYVKTVNGIYADYNTTRSYWSINKNGEYMMTGVDDEEIENGNTYEFIYTKN